MTRKQVGKRSSKSRVADRRTPPPSGGEGNREAEHHYREKTRRFSRAGGLADEPNVLDENDAALDEERAAGRDREE